MIDHPEWGFRYANFNSDVSHIEFTTARPFPTFFTGEMVRQFFGADRAKKHPESKTYSYIFSRVAPSRPEEKGTFRDQEHLLA